MSITEKRLNEIQKRLNAATDGPWCHWSGWDQTDNCVSREDMHTVVAEVIPESDDARFIAHAREDVPALLAEVEWLRERFTVNDDMVERAARESYGPKMWDRLLLSQDTLASVQLSAHRAMTRAALEAVFSTGGDA